MSLFLQSRYHVRITNRLVGSSHTCQKGSRIREPLIQSICFMTWCHNRARTYSVPFLQHLAVRTSQRYDLTSWSSQPLWLNAVIQDMWGKGLLNSPDLIRICSVCVCVWLLVVWKGVNKLAFLIPLCISIVLVFSYEVSSPPHDIFQKESPACYFKARSWWLVNTKQYVWVNCITKGIWTMRNFYVIR